jgi:hypothetical protein
MRLKQSQGPITVTVFTPAAIYASAPTDVSVLLQRSDSAELLLDATVTLRSIPASGVVIAPTKEFCEIRADNETIVATHKQAASKFMYAAPVVFPAPGDWTLQALVRWHEQVISIESPLSILSPESRLTGLVPYLALPMVAIALFLANQWLRRPRLDQPVALMPEQFGVFIPPTRSKRTSLFR